MIFFLSSSFADMQVERDLMMFDVMPAFRRIATEHGDYAAHLDLRWGIKTWDLNEEEIANRVLDTCEKAIDDSRPYIIVFLSRRYGSINLTPKGISVTAYEIEYALKEKMRCIICHRVIHKKDIPKNFWNIYFDHEEKVTALFNDLKQKYPQNVIEYTATWQGDKFGNFLTNDGKSLREALLEKMEALCLADWEVTEKLDWQAKEIFIHNRLYRQKSKEFFGRKEKLAEIIEKLNSSNVIFLESEAGGGKTTICAKTAMELNQRDFVLCIFAGTTNRTSTVQDILKLMIFFSEEILNQSHRDFAEEYVQWKIYFTEVLIPKLSKLEQQVYFVLDGLDQLRNDSHRNEFDFLPSQSENNVHFLISYATDNEFKLPLKFYNPIADIKNDNIFEISEIELEEKSKEMLQEIIRKFGEDFLKELIHVSYGVSYEVASNLTKAELCQIYKQAILITKENFSAEDDDAPVKYLRLKLLEPSEVFVIIDGLLSIRGRELFNGTSTAVSAKRNSTNPLYLRLISTLLNFISSKELQQLQQPSDIVELTVSLIEELPDEPAEAANYILNKVADLLCSNSIGTIKAFRIIAASRNGLRPSDLQNIFGKDFRQVDFTLVQNYLSDFFTTVSDGRITFSHALIKSGINNDPDLENLIATHIKSLPVYDLLRADEIFYYAQKNKDYELAARLCGESWYKRNPELKQRLTYSIFREIFSDGGNFFEDLLNNHLQDLSDKAIGGIWLFFVGDKSIQNEFYGSILKHSTFLRILDCISINWKYFKQAFEACDIENTDFGYYLVVMLQAQYNFLVGETEITSKLCQEIINWSENDLELKNCSNTAAEFCKMTYDAYRILRIISSSDNENNYLYLLEREFFWLSLLFEIEPTKRIEFTLTELRCIIADEKYSTKLISAEEFLNELKGAYNLVLKHLKKSHTDFQLLLMMLNICMTITNLSLYAPPKHVDRIIFWAEKTKFYIRKCLSLNDNNPDVLRMVGKAWRLLCNVTIMQKDSAALLHYSLESKELYTRLYATNPTWRHLKLCIEALTTLGDNCRRIGNLKGAIFSFETALQYVRIGETHFPEYDTRLTELKKIIRSKQENLTDFRL